MASDESGSRADRLSNLPDPLITSILSSLPLKNAAATSLLSKRWRHAWHSITHLALGDAAGSGCRSAAEDFTTWRSMLDSVLRSIDGPVTSCLISFQPANHLFRDYTLSVDNLLSWLRDKKTEELSVLNNGALCYQVPLDSLFSKSAKKLELRKCSVVFPPSSHLLSCAALTSLVLFRVCVTNSEFEQLVASCIALESLRVDCCVKLRHLKISAAKLSSLEIVTVKKIRISLERIGSLSDVKIWFQYALENSYIHFCDDPSREEDDDQANKLVRLLTDLSGGQVECLSLHFCIVFAECLQRQKVDLPQSLPPQYWLSTVKKLNLELNLSNLHSNSLLYLLLNTLPDLRELIIRDKEHVATVNSYWGTMNTPECLMHRLKIVQIQQVNIDRNYWMGLVKFLLSNASVCERIIVQYYGRPWGKMWVETQLKNLERASVHVVLELQPCSESAC